MLKPYPKTPIPTFIICGYPISLKVQNTGVAKQYNINNHINQGPTTPAQQANATNEQQPNKFKPMKAV